MHTQQALKEKYARALTSVFCEWIWKQCVIGQLGLQTKKINSLIKSSQKITSISHDVFQSLTAELNYLNVTLYLAIVEQ